MEASCYADPNFAIICGFFEKFGKMCGIPFPLASDLLSMLECEEGVPQELASLHTQLLRKIRRTTSVEKWERTAVKFCKAYLPDDAAEFEEKGYLGCTTGLKLRLLRTLLETQFDQNTRFKSAVNLLTAEELRQKPMGKDSSGRIYWCHLDAGANLKVYREDPAAENGDWTVVASDRTTMVDLIKTLTGDNTMDLSPIVEPPAPVMDTGQASSDDTDGEERVDKQSDGSGDENVENILSEGATEADDSDDKEAAESTSVLPTGDEKVKEDDACKKRKIESDEDNNSPDNKKPKVAEEGHDESVSEAIEEPTMLVQGEGNGADCENGVPFECSEAIEEDVFYVRGEGSGAECDAGNDEREDLVNSSEQPSDPMSSTIDRPSSDQPVGEPSTTTEDLPGSAADGLQVVSSSLEKSPVASNAEKAVCPPSSSGSGQQEAGADSSDCEKPKLWSIDDICSTSDQDTSNSEGNVASCASETVLDNSSEANDKKTTPSDAFSVPEPAAEQVTDSIRPEDLDTKSTEEISVLPKDEERTCQNLSVPEIIITPNTPETAPRLKNDSPLAPASPEPDPALPPSSDVSELEVLGKSMAFSSGKPTVPLNPDEVSAEVEPISQPIIQVEEVNLPQPSNLILRSNSERANERTEITHSDDTEYQATNSSDSTKEDSTVKSENSETKPVPESLHESAVPSSGEVEPISQTIIQVEEVNLPESNEALLRSDSGRTTERKETTHGDDTKCQSTNSLDSTKEDSTIKLEDAETGLARESCPENTEETSNSGELVKKPEVTSSNAILGENPILCVENSPLNVVPGSGVEEKPTVAVQKKSGEIPAICHGNPGTFVPVSDSENGASTDSLVAQPDLEGLKREEPSIIDEEKSMLNNAETIAIMSQKMGLNCSESEINDKPLGTLSALGSIGKLENMVDDFKKGNPVDVSAYSAAIDTIDEKNVAPKRYNDDELKMKPQVTPNTFEVNSEKAKESVEQKPTFQNENNGIAETPEVSKGKVTEPVETEPNPFITKTVNKTVAVQGPDNEASAQGTEKLISVEKTADNAENSEGGAETVEGEQVITCSEVAEPVQTKSTNPITIETVNQTFKVDIKRADPSVQDPDKEASARGTEKLISGEATTEKDNAEKSEGGAEIVEDEQVTTCSEVSETVQTKPNNPVITETVNKAVEVDIKIADSSVEDLEKKASAQGTVKLISGEATAEKGNVEKTEGGAETVEDGQVTKCSEVAKPAKVDIKSTDPSVEDLDKKVSTQGTEKLISGEKTAEKDNIEKSEDGAETVDGEQVTTCSEPDKQEPAGKNLDERKNVKVSDKDKSRTIDENDVSKADSESDDDREVEAACSESGENDVSSESHQKSVKSPSSQADTSTVNPAESAKVDDKTTDIAKEIEGGEGIDRGSESEKDEKSNLAGKRKRGKKKPPTKKGNEVKDTSLEKEDPLLEGNEDPLATLPKEADPLALGEDTGKRKKKKKSAETKPKTEDSDASNTEKDKKKSKTGSYYIPAREIQLLGASEESTGSPTGVRQSRRIAVIKLKEAEERRRQEEIELEAFKSKTKKKKEKLKYDEDYQEEESEEEEEEKHGRKTKKEKKYKFDPKKAWMTSSDDDDEADEEAEPEEDEIEEEHEEPVYKSDHEFSPESDVEDPDYQPVRVARTAQGRKVTPDKYEDVACEVCEKSDQPEWILLCDKCDKGSHTSCLTPLLHMVPDGEWFCPACSLAQLVVNLKKTLRDYDRCEKQRENEELRKKRIAFVGISLDNVLPPAKKPKKAERDDSESESGSESGSGRSVRSGSGHSSDDSAPVYQLRERRTNTSSYRFNEYDELIRSAIRDEMGEECGVACEAAAPESKAQPSAQDQGKKTTAVASDEEEGEEGDDEKAEEKLKKGGDYSAETDADSDADEPPPVVPRKRKTKKKRKKLLSLDFSSDDEDDQNSDSDFKGSSLDEDEEDFEEDGSDSDFSGGGRKRKGQRGSTATRRSARARQRRLDKDFIDDETSEDAVSGSNREFDTTESSDSDRSWGRKKKNKSRKRRPVTPPSRKKKKVTKKKNRKKVKTADSDEEDDGEYKSSKKKKVKYGLDSDPESKITNRRTRGKQINFVWDNDGTDSEQERLKRKRRTGRVGRFASEESDEEFKVLEDEKLEEDDEDEAEFNSEDASSDDVPAKKKSKMEKSKPVAKANSAKKSKPDKKVTPAKKIKDVSSESDDDLNDLDEEAEEELMEMLDKRDMPVDELKDAIKKTKERMKEPEPVVKKKGCKVKITPTRAEIAEKAAAAKAKKTESASLLKKVLDTEEMSKIEDQVPNAAVPTIPNAVGQDGGIVVQSAPAPHGPPGPLPQVPPLVPPNMAMGVQQNLIGPHGGPPPTMVGPQGGHPMLGPMMPHLPRAPMHPQPGMVMPPGGYPPNAPRMPMGPMQHMQMMSGMQRGPPPGMPPHGMPPQTAGPHPLSPMGGQQPGMPLSQSGVRMPMGGQFPPQGAFPVQGQFGSPGSPNFSPSPEAKQRRKPGPKPGSKNKKKVDGEESPGKGKPRNRKGDDVTIATVQAPTQFPEAANVEEGSVITRMLNSTEGGVPEGAPGHHMLGAPRPTAPLYHAPRPMDPSPSGGGAVAVAKPPFPPGQFPAQFQNFHQPPFPGFSDGSFPSEQVPQGPQGPTPVQVPNDVEEVSEFGGLASYFASQAEEDMDT